MRRIADLILLVALLSLCASALLFAEDWPQWRYDSAHGASSPEELPDKLHLQWIRKYSRRQQTWQEPINDSMVTYDRIFEPVVAGGRMFLGFNDTNKLVALDTATGEELWGFYAEGPVRLPPIATRDRVFFVSDDSFLYCLAADSGNLLWKFRAAPYPHKCIGNERIVSCWPARGGPAMQNGLIYFAAGMWPFMGVFIYAINAETGQVVWVNDTSGGIYCGKPHVSEGFGSVGPQGTLVVTDEIVITPGGRSVPAGFDKKTGKFLFFNNNGGMQGWGSAVIADKTHFYARTRSGVIANTLNEGKTQTDFQLDHEPVLSKDRLYVAEKDKIIALTYTVTDEETIDRKGKKQKQRVVEKNKLWEIKVDATGDLIRAGNRLYAAGSMGITAVGLPGLGESAKAAWMLPIKGKILRLLAANGRLFAVTLDGRIMTFGASAGNASPILRKAKQPPSKGNTRLARDLLKNADAPSNYVICFGLDDGELIRGLITESELHVVGVDENADVLDQMRREFDQSGLYGERVTLFHGSPHSFKAPSYFARLVVLGKRSAEQYSQPDFLKEMYRSVRPYGGKLWLPIEAERQKGLMQLIENGVFPKAKAKSFAGGLLITREGALPGSADWTHQYGDIRNTLKSDDRLVKLPLGILWFGGNTHMDILPRHGNGPPEQVIDGRLIIQGVNSISARDVYTGRRLWKTTFEEDELGTFGLYYDQSLTPGPIPEGKSQRHLAGARLRGANFVATSEYVYIVLGAKVRLLDIQTGETFQNVQMPEVSNRQPEWGFIGVYDDILLGGIDFARYRDAAGDWEGLPFEYDHSASTGIIAFDRFNGEELWRVMARYGFIHNGIVAGNDRVFLLDILPDDVIDKIERRGGKVPDSHRILALDAQTGGKIWENDEGIDGIWLSLSQERDILVLSSDAQPGRLNTFTGGFDARQRKLTGIKAFSAKDGSVLWSLPDFEYAGPVILHNDLIMSNIKSNWRDPYGYSGVLNLLDGTPNLTKNPLSGKAENWRITRNYGCSAAIASEYLLTFRSGSVGYLDLVVKGGTGNLSGFKTGCSSNLVAANGVINAPDYTRSFSCSFPNQTSLALIHMPDIETEHWTAQYAPIDWDNWDATAKSIPFTEQVKQVGINLGAAGDRMSANGTLWLEYPAVGGVSLEIPIDLAGNPDNTARRFSSVVSGPLPWVCASFLGGIESLKIGLNTAKKEAKYAVALYFAELEDVGKGERVFDVFLQNERVLKSLDIVSATGGRFRGVSRTFSGIAVDDKLTISFQKAADSKYPPILSGVEIIAER